MNIVLKGTNLSLTPALQAYVKNKLNHLDKLGVKIQIARVELESLTEKKTDAPFRAEANLDSGKIVFRAESFEADMYAAIDKLIPKLSAQMEKIKLKSISRDRKSARRLKNPEINI